MWHDEIDNTLPGYFSGKTPALAMAGATRPPFINDDWRFNHRAFIKVTQYRREEVPR